MLAETLQAGRWLSPITGHIAFGLYIETNSNHFGWPSRSGTGDWLDINGKGRCGLPGSGGGTLHFGTGKFGLPWNIGPAEINRDAQTTATGRAPRPSSNHPASVNVVFCDGRAMSLSERIDHWVYARLVSSAGTRQFNHAYQELISTNSFE